ncbi:MAG: mannose-1-phosphate guanylyltransferase [Limimaricola soesokkakensis]|uniref:mannose-1-phosphate guanylyltransferase n=1 Tax=Limimaricola soesokkakensis TaxID=1343159 RepID=UPI00405812F2
MQTIVPVILCGGMGSRLWPLSRQQQPKQFQSVDGRGGPTFLQTTALRHRGKIFAKPLIVTGGAQMELVAEQMAEIDCTPTILGEPLGRNTGPAVLAAALKLSRTDPSTLMLVLPADHVIEGDLNRTIADAAPAARDGRIVVMGIEPSYPETGFGYMTSDGSLADCPGLHAVRDFIEKPDHDRAVALIEAGSAYWAAGISLMRADHIIAEYARLEPETLEAVRRALDTGEESCRGTLLDRDSFAKALNEPTERAIFERSASVAMAPVTVKWNDVGAWSAMHSIGMKCSNGNVVGPEVLALNTRNSLVRGCGKLIAVVGMDDVIVVDTPDALLVTTHSQAQFVKDAVAHLTANNRIEVIRHALPQGLGAALKPPAQIEGVRRIEVAPKGSAELTGTGQAGTVVTIAGGTALLKVQGRTRQAKAGEIFLIRPGQTALVANAGLDGLGLVTVDIEAEAKAGRTAFGPEVVATHRGGRQVA